jgi:Tfp pilus assembly protein PilF
VHKISSISIVVVLLVAVGLASACRPLTSSDNQGPAQSPGTSAASTVVPVVPAPSPDLGGLGTQDTVTPEASAGSVTSSVNLPQSVDQTPGVNSSPSASEETPPNTGPEQPIEPEAPQHGIDYYNEAVRVNPSNADVYINRGLAYQSLGQFYEAVGDCGEAITLSPKNCVAYRLRGTVYRDAGWSKEAFADFNQAILINPEYARAYYDRAICYCSVGQPAPAVADCDESIRLDSGYANSYALRAVVYEYLEQFQQSVADFSEAIRLQPVASLYAGRGRAYYKFGLFEQAIADYGYKGRGLAYEALGRKTDAVADFEVVIAITDNQSLADEARQQIEKMSS